MQTRRRRYENRRRYSFFGASGGGLSTSEVGDSFTDSDFNPGKTSHLARAHDVRAAVDYPMNPNISESVAIASAS